MWSLLSSFLDDFVPAPYLASQASRFLPKSKHAVMLLGRFEHLSSIWNGDVRVVFQTLMSAHFVLSRCMNHRDMEGMQRTGMGKRQRQPAILVFIRAV